ATPSPPVSTFHGRNSCPSAPTGRRSCLFPCSFVRLSYQGACLNGVLVLPRAGFNTPAPPPLMNLIKRYVASVPDDPRYLAGNVPSQSIAESPWANAHFVQITEPKEFFARILSFVDAI